MFQTETANRKKMILMALLAVLVLFASAAAYAEPITYTFSGAGAGTINGTAFSGDFSFVFTSDTADVATFGTEFIDQTLAGTFTEGNTSFTVDPIFGIIVNPAAGTPRLGFFNPAISSALVLQNNNFIGYDLTTSISASSSDPSGSLFDELGGDGFSLDGGADTLIFTSDSSLDFTAAVGTTSVTPEPSSIFLLFTGICGGAALLCRRVAA